jgi:hypothetical protein
MQAILDDIDDKKQFIQSYLTREQNTSDELIQEMQDKLEDEIADKTFKTTENNASEISKLDLEFSTNRNRTVTDNIVAREILTKKLDDRRTELEKVNSLEAQIQATHNANMREVDKDISAWEEMKNKEILGANTTFNLLKTQYALQIKAKEKAAADRLIAVEQAAAELEAASKSQQLAEAKILERQSSNQSSTSNQSSNQSSTSNQSSNQSQGSAPNQTQSKGEKVTTSDPAFVKVNTTTLETPLGSVEIDEKDYKIYYFIIFIAFAIIIAILIYKNFRGARITKELNEQAEKEKITNLIYAAN